MAGSTNESKTIFMHHLDTLEVNALKKYLIEENLSQNCYRYEIRGTVNKQTNMCKIMHSRHPLTVVNPAADDFIERIIECDLMIFNAASPNFENVCIHMRQVMTALEEWTLAEQSKSDKLPEKKKYVILISTPMTWALSRNDLGEEEDGEPVEDLLYEDDYRRRKTYTAYCKHKLLERDVIWVQKKCKNFVRSLVVCPGVVYGDENYVFHYIFKRGFYNKTVPILWPGTQNIPMIYSLDYAKIMKEIVDDFPEAKHRYIFAVQPQSMSLKTFTYNMCKSFNGDCCKVRFTREIEMLAMEKDLFPQSVIDLLSLDIKMVPTYLKDFPFHELNESFWDELAQEFRDTRNLHPLKIIIDGPPLVGKTELAHRLAEYYHLLYIDIREIVSDYIKYLEEQINDGRNFVEKLEFPEQRFESGKQPALNEKEGLRKLDEEDNKLILDLKNSIEKWSKQQFSLKVCLIALISTKQYDKNHGYVIDGFPFKYEEANQIFFNTKHPTGSENWGMANILKPTHFIVFDATDEVLCNRAMGLTETEAIIRRCLRHEMLPRLDAYRERNDESLSLTDLFYDNDINPIHVSIACNTIAADTLRILTAKIGHPFTYPLTKEQQKILSHVAAEARQREEEEQRRKNEEFIKTLKLERERKISDWTAKYEELRKHEHEMREVKTLPLRQYLEKYVLPTLTEGILKIAELKPDDPVDFLAEYLFKCNPEGQQLPPFCTEEQRQRFYNTFTDDLTSESDYKVTDSRLEKEDCP